MGGPILIEDLKETILHTIVVAETKIFDETSSQANWLVTKVPLLLYFARL